MARKNLIGISEEQAPPASTAAGGTTGRPLAGFVPPPRAVSPIGGITKSLSNITSTMERAQGLEKQLAAGQTIVDLDPILLDSSFVSDRLEIEEVELSQLVEQIRENGQQVPILVRPHPEARGRYQVAYGHRRLAAIRRLGLKVRAVVRDLTDDQLVVSQGQENNSRTNLSYIERALFAARLEERTFGRDIIMSALGVDKAALSKMLATVKQVPLELVEAIGPAPEVGRRRWMELAEKLDYTKVAALVKLLRSEHARAVSSGERFQLVVDEVAKKEVAKQRALSGGSVTQPWISKDKLVSVRLTLTARRGTVVVEAKDGPEFASFIGTQLEGLYEVFSNSRKNRLGD